MTPKTPHDLNPAAAHHWCRTVSLVLLWAGVGSNGFAQAVSAPASDPGGVVKLSPFVVNTEDDGWLAGNTLLANRTNQPLKEVPVTIDSLTPEFLLDVGAFDAYAAAEWSANSYVETEGQKAVAGTLASSTAPQDALRYSFRGTSTSRTRFATSLAPRAITAWRWIREGRASSISRM